MRNFILKSILTLALCAAAFTLAFGVVRQASGEGARNAAAPVVEATVTAEAESSMTPDATATDSASTSTPEEMASSTPVPSRTPAPKSSSPPLEEMGREAKAGTVFEDYGVRLQIPNDRGDFRVIYPIIVDPPPPGSDDGVIMTVYNIKTHSSVFLGFDKTSDGVRLVERGRHTENSEANTALDAIASSAEVTGQ